MARVNSPLATPPTSSCPLARTICGAIVAVLGLAFSLGGMHCLQAAGPITEELPTPTDEVWIDVIRDAMVQDGASLRALILAIVKAPPFRSRQLVTP